MKETIQQYLLNEIVTEWKTLPNKFRPWGVWIRLYPPIPPMSDPNLCILSLPNKVWFLDNNGLYQHSIWEFQRFIVVHGFQPWCLLTTKERTKVFGDPHEIGLVAFAHYDKSNDIYLEKIWGGRYGRGLRIIVDSSDSIINYNDLWVS
jgi:hypothetical protein